MSDGIVGEKTSFVANGAAPARERIGIVSAVVIVLLGIVLPLVAMAGELIWRPCAQWYVDPLSSWGFAALVAWVPLANALGLAALLRGSARRLRGLDWASGLAIGSGLYYSLVFLPVAPFAVIGIIFYGIGLLPLSPLLSVIASALLRRRIRQNLVPNAPGFHLNSVWRGILAAFGCVLLLTVPASLTSVGAGMAESTDPAIQAAGLSLLRQWASREALLRSCYVANGRPQDPAGFLLGEILHPVSANRAQALYYRVTGTPFNAVRPPRAPGTVGRERILDEFDFGIGGDAVNARVRGLYLKESRMDSNLDPDACLAYTEWTLVFLNKSSRQQEARAQIVLPPGGVVSRLTLWINGEEREAAFGTRDQTRRAYQSVVQRRRDPVLVTTCGTDRILAQCFPVPPNDGVMKIRLGITSPLTPTAPDRAVLRLPFAAERNFGVTTGLKHTVWTESQKPFDGAKTPSGFVSEQSSRGAYILRGDPSEQGVDRPLALHCTRSADVRQCWTRDLRAPSSPIVRQTLREETVPPPDRLAIVVDGSRRMGEYRRAVAEALETMPEGIEFGVWQASDKIVELAPMQPGTAAALRSAAQGILHAEFEGGCDNTPALEKAWELAAGRRAGAILWLHASQPMEPAAMESLRQKWERRPDGPVLYDLQFGGGPNAIATRLDGLPAVRSASVTGDPAGDLRRLTAAWSGKATRFILDRTTADGAAVEGKETWDHLARLWALDRVQELSRSRRDADRQSAMDTATRYQLVTPLSGAVVLETTEQYQQAGLTPASSESVPTMSVPSVPEPEEWALILVVLVVFVMLVLRKPQRPVLEVT